MLWGGGSRVVRGDTSDEPFRVTVFPLPTRPMSDLTAQHRSEAIESTYTGYLSQAIDLYRQISTEDGWQSGILHTIGDGILGLPAMFQGDAAMIDALQDSNGVAGDFSRMYPIRECSQIFIDGIATNFGLGQYVLMCWGCGFTDIDTHAVCKTCGACQLARPIGTRKLFQLQWRDPRWLYQNTVTRQLYYTGNGGMIPIRKGDGEWFLFQPYPEVDAWRHGPWLYMTLAGIFARDAMFDRQRVSEVTTPVPVVTADQNTTSKARQEMHEELLGAKFDRRFTLPGGWTYEIVSCTAEYSSVAAEIAEWATGMVEVGLTGNLMGMKASAAFTDASIYARVGTVRRRKFAGAWVNDIMQQGLPWWGLDNYGTRSVPIMSVDVESPEDKLAASKSIEQEGKTLISIKDGLDAHGAEVEPSWLVERMQKLGIRIRMKPNGAAATSKIGLAPTDIANAVTADEAKNSEGLQPFGDDRGDMTVGQLGDMPAETPAAAPSSNPPPKPRRKRGAK